MLLAPGVVCIVSVPSELREVWGVLRSLGGCLGGTLAGELVGIKGIWGELVGEWRGNYSKEVDPETAGRSLGKSLIWWRTR